MAVIIVKGELFMMYCNLTHTKENLNISGLQN